MIHGSYSSTLSQTVLLYCVCSNVRSLWSMLTVWWSGGDWETLIMRNMNIEHNKLQERVENKKVVVPIYLIVYV